MCCIKYWWSQYSKWILIQKRELYIKNETILVYDTVSGSSLLGIGYYLVDPIYIVSSPTSRTDDLYNVNPRRFSPYFHYIGNLVLL